MKYRIVEEKDGLGKTKYFVEEYGRIWHAPWMFGWRNVLSWDDCGFGVPWFNSLKKAQEYKKLLETPIERKVVE